MVTTPHPPTGCYYPQTSANFHVPFQSTESKKRLALAIINFLETSTTDGTLKADDKESIEVATQCISEAFEVDPTDSAAVSDALGGQSLLAIYSVFEKMKSAKAPAAKSPAAAAPNPSTPAGPSAQDIARADALKGQGNSAMQRKDYTAAVDFYTQALNIVPKNTIYLSNRAAAYSNLQKYDEAIQDAQIAVDTDPTYTKAWSRLGLARFAKGDARGAMEAYQAGIDAEGNGGSEIMRRGYETAKKRVEEEDAVAPPKEAERSGSPKAAGGMPDLASLAGMFGGQGGGMPDLGSMLKNPMISQMAQNLMSNPGMMGELMNNPKLKEMMEGAGNGGGMPDIGSLMSDPSIAEM